VAFYLPLIMAIEDVHILAVKSIQVKISRSGQEYKVVKFAPVTFRLDNYIELDFEVERALFPERKNEDKGATYASDPLYSEINNIGELVSGRIVTYQLCFPILKTSQSISYVVFHNERAVDVVKKSLNYWPVYLLDSYGNIEYVETNKLVRVERAETP
jgi:hypothetical protein